MFLAHKQCGDTAQVIANLAKRKDPTRIWTDIKTATAVNQLNGTTSLANIDAVLVGDEVDGMLGGTPRSTLATVQATAAIDRSIITYQGAKTNGHVGAYSGITDVQGSDAYCAACAPTIVPVIKQLPLQYPYVPFMCITEGRG